MATREPFVCFGSALKWKSAINTDKPVNLECVTKPGKPGKFGVSLSMMYIVLSQVLGGEVLYFQQPIGAYSMVNGEPIETDEGIKKRQARMDSALFAAEAWLKLWRIPYRIAMLAQPANLVLLDGVAEFMKYDKATDLYEPLPAGVLTEARTEPVGVAIVAKMGTPCPYCAGTGMKPSEDRESEESCEECNGTGWAPAAE